MRFVAGGRLRGLAAASALAVGCDDSGYSFGDSGLDTALDTLIDDLGPPVVTPAPTTTGTTPTGPIASMGTQVGSEGFWDCTVLGSQLVPDASATIPSLDVSAAQATAARVGAWPLTVTSLGDGAVRAGTLTLADDGVYLWVDVAETAEDPLCVDHLAASVSGTLAVDAWTAPVAGVVAVRPTDGRVVVDAEALAADLEPVWGPSPLDPAATRLRLDASVTATDLAGPAAYVDCAALVCAGEAPLADVTGAR